MAEWSEKLKIKRQMLEAMEEAGMTSPKAIQELTMPRINGGQDIIGVGPAGIGKTTTYVLSVINKLKFALEEAPRALVLVADKDKVTSTVEAFQSLSKNTNLRTVGFVAGVGMEPQMDALADGVDIIVGTPDRIRSLYLKLGLNVNKLQMFILDDAHELIKQGFQLPVLELARSLPKCQHLVFTEVMHEKLSKLIDPFLNFPFFAEVEEIPESTVEVFDQSLYVVPNFKTKLNLLNLLLLDKEQFFKTLILVNSKTSLDKVFQRLQQVFKEEVILFKPSNFHVDGCDSIEEFVGTKKWRLMVGQLQPELINIKTLPQVIILEIPVAETYLELIRKEPGLSENPFFVAISTELELSSIKKVEVASNKKMKAIELPQGLRIETDNQKVGLDPEKSKTPIKEEKQIGDAAFHEKKASNAKTYNYGYKDKMKMSGKISKRRKD
jgi:hypothetical protein